MMQQNIAERNESITHSEFATGAQGGTIGGETRQARCTRSREYVLCHARSLRSHYI
jgi:hypothetical protein